MSYSSSVHMVHSLSCQERRILLLLEGLLSPGGESFITFGNELLFSEIHVGLSVKAPSPAYRMSEAGLPYYFSSRGSPFLTDFKLANPAATQDVPATPRATSVLNLSNNYFASKRNHNEFASPSAPPKRVHVETRLGLFGIPWSQRPARPPSKRKLFNPTSNSKLGVNDINTFERIDEADSKDNAAAAKPPRWESAVWPAATTSTFSDKASSDNVLETASSPLKDAGDHVGTEPQPIEETKSVNQPNYTIPHDSVATLYVKSPLITLPASSLLDKGSSVSSRDGSATSSTDGSAVCHMSTVKLPIVLDIGVDIRVLGVLIRLERRTANTSILASLPSLDFNHLDLLLDSKAIALILLPYSFVAETEVVDGRGLPSALEGYRMVTKSARCGGCCTPGSPERTVNDIPLKSEEPEESILALMLFKLIVYA
eukprot:gene30401-35406_t